MTTTTAAVPDTTLDAYARSARRAVALAGLLFAVVAIRHAMLAASYGTTDDAEALTIAAYFAFSVAGLLWLQWFQALAVPFERRGLTRFTGWSRLGWLVPLVAFVLPKKLVNDVWRAGRPRAAERLPWQVQAWWALWVTAQAASGVARSSDTPLAMAVFSGTLALCAPFAVSTLSLLTRRAALTPYSAGVEPPSTATAQPVT